MPTSAYRTKDGHINVAASGEGMWKSLCTAIGREDMLADPDFKGGKKRADNRKKLNAAIEQALLKKSGAEWIEILNQAGIPCGPIYSIDQMFADPQVRHLGVAAPVEHPKLGRKQVLANAAVLSRTPARVVAATPEVGEHTDEILGELGYAAPEIDQLHKGGVV